MKGAEKEHIHRRTAKAKACWGGWWGRGPGEGASELEHLGNLPGKDVAAEVAVDGGLPVDRLLQVQIPVSGRQLAFLFAFCTLSVWQQSTPM